MNPDKYIQYKRRHTYSVSIGGLALGSLHAIRVQSMTNTPTADIEATAQQIETIKNAGSDYVRVTVPTLKEARGLKSLIYALGKRKCDIPVIADIHFNPRLAFISAEIVSKVRINPGNFVDKRGSDIRYMSDDYKKEQEKLRSKFTELLHICRKHNTAIRIGTNHGSLSDRIVGRFGDTPRGMAESAMEFVRICKENSFTEVVVSMKASNTRIMVYATRILVEMMEAENMHYPIHLGVTEAGEGEDGRIRSAVGIGTLLADGIGDTVRVSLTEDPEKEIPVAKKLVQYVSSWEGHDPIPEFGSIPIELFDFSRRKSIAVGCVGGSNQPVVVKYADDETVMAKLGWTINKNTWQFTEISPDCVVVEKWSQKESLPVNKHLIFNRNSNERNSNCLFNWEQYRVNNNEGALVFLKMKTSEVGASIIDELSIAENVVLVLESGNLNAFADFRSAIFRLMNANCRVPIILKRTYSDIGIEDFQLKAAVDTGGLFIDGLADGIWLEAPEIKDETVVQTAFGILQASRVRFSKTEYISCPSCGRTLFDLQETTHRIQEVTSHLKGLKIGIMGCIVNGPGEMADADYGYVGTGKGKVTLYKEREVVKKNIPEESAVDELVHLIKENGDWIEPKPH